jgi:hypothetical protein
MTNNLLPCPWCRCPGLYNTGGDEVEPYNVFCSNSDCMTRMHGLSPMPLEDWSTRAPDAELKALVEDVFNGAQMVWRDIKASRDYYGRSIAYFGNLTTPLDELCKKVGLEIPKSEELEKGKLTFDRRTPDAEKEAMRKALDKQTITDILAHAQRLADAMGLIYFYYVGWDGESDLPENWPLDKGKKMSPAEITTKSLAAHAKVIGGKE